ncbi:hypothetical protein DCO58_01515 [Helicobacter saguini]|uniref:Uncharacterized protein n=1 Tax=Helicobacter saguini TaxID=1548018 RepID=A0A347W1R6_9HELI|nr:hypothetical protein [Helicobacter saguini]MWV62939.1 hypothetical protein [Helicobacter saguini]MWV66391.1 hypothetical protein [Helicobacter saguini]MWV68743.1 hypothetical protein [Helicobacter saguini]MWV71704.1 hypothetical protein [Helicobacter saguini]TLD91884.1 hypothetical protein LS64_011225 [Helicobacter saguini]
MKTLKIFYICWVMFWGLGCVIGGAMGHNATFLGMLYLFFLLILMPLFPYFFYLIYEKINKAKRLFFVVVLYLLLLLCVILYYFILFFEFHSDSFLFYLINTIVCIAIFIIIYKNKRQSK